MAGIWKNAHMVCMSALSLLSCTLCKDTECSYFLLLQHLLRLLLLHLLLRLLLRLLLWLLLCTRKISYTCSDVHFSIGAMFLFLLSLPACTKLLRLGNFLFLVPSLSLRFFTVSTLLTSAGAGAAATDSVSIFHRHDIKLFFSNCTVITNHCIWHPQLFSRRMLIKNFS